MNPHVRPRGARSPGWFLQTGPLSDEEAAVRRARDEAKIRGAVRRLCRAWADGDGAAYAAEFTEDADYVAFDGTRVQGQFQNAEVHDELFQTVLRGTRLAGDVESLRFLPNDVAIVSLTGGVVFAGQEPNPDRTSRQTLVMVRDLAGWKIASFQTTHITPGAARRVARPTTPAGAPRPPPPDHRCVRRG